MKGPLAETYLVYATLCSELLTNNRSLDNYSARPPDIGLHAGKQSSLFDLENNCI